MAVLFETSNVAAANFSVELFAATIGRSGDSKRTWQADGACHGNIEDERIYHFAVGTLYDDNSKRDITARSLAIFSVGEEPRRKICVWCLILYSLHAASRRRRRNERTTRTRQSRRRSEGGYSRARVSSTVGETSLSLLPLFHATRLRSPFELRLLSRSNRMTAKCRCCHITVSTEDITEGCLVGHAVSLWHFLRNFCCFDGHTSTRISSSFHRVSRLLDANAVIFVSLLKKF